MFFFFFFFTKEKKQKYKKYSSFTNATSSFKRPQNVLYVIDCLVKLNLFQLHEAEGDRKKLGVCGSKRAPKQVFFTESVTMETDSEYELPQQS